MAKVKIQGHASGTGVLTVTAPNTSTDRTITLPDTTGTLLDENSSVPAANLTGTVATARLGTGSAGSGNFLRGDGSWQTAGSTSASDLTSGTLASARLPSGSVLQVVATVLGSTFAYTGGATWTNTGVVASITPSSSSNKILIMPSIALGMSVDGVNVRLRCLRSVSGGSDTVVGSPTGGGDGFTHLEQNQSGNNYVRFLESTNILDSPNTTSAITYYIQIYRNTTAGTAYLNRGHTDQSRQHSGITLLEIAG